MRAPVKVSRVFSAFPRSLFVMRLFSRLITVNPYNRQAIVGIDALEEFGGQTTPPRHQHLFLVARDAEGGGARCDARVCREDAEAPLLSRHARHIQDSAKHAIRLFTRTLARSRSRAFRKLFQAADGNPRYPAVLLASHHLAAHVPVARFHEAPREMQERRRFPAALVNRPNDGVHKVQTRQFLARSRVAGTEVRAILHHGAIQKMALVFLQLRIRLLRRHARSVLPHADWLLARSRC